MLLNNGSLVPRPPPFLYFFWFVLNIIHGSGKSSEKWGRPGNIHHMNDVRWMRGGHKVDIDTRVLDFIIEHSVAR